MLTKDQAYEVLMHQQQAMREDLVVMRPLVANVPTAPAGATEVTCKCGRQCWKLAMEPDQLPPHVYGACSGCALKAGFERKGFKTDGR